jgi:hypothetical protein
MSKELLQQLYNACDPQEPADKSNYVDCGEARGGGVLAERFLRHLENATSGKNEIPCAFLCSGHVGCGKSSELLRLAHSILKNPVGGKRFYPVVINFLEYMDDYDFGISDLLLTVVTELADVFREKLGIELKDGYFQKRLAEAGSFLKSDIDADHLEVGLFGFKTRLQRMKTVGAKTRRDIRTALDPHVTTMAEEINTVFSEARNLLRRHKPIDGGEPFEDFVLILDDLEKVQGFESKERGIVSHRELFLENAPRLNKLRAHIIFTVPLELIRFDGAQLEQKYIVSPFVLPMVKVEERNGHQFVKGRLAIQRLLEKRVGGATELNQVFEPDALEFLVKYSGGHVRNLLRFIREACTYADGAPITLKNAQKALGPTIRLYSTSIPDTHWEKLARLDLSEKKKIDSGDADFTLMLRNLNILEYVNGGDDDPFAEEEPWYAVNPIVRELQSFKAAVEKLRGETQTPAVLPVTQTIPLVPVNNP